MIGSTSDVRSEDGGKIRGLVVRGQVGLFIAVLFP